MHPLSNAVTQGGEPIPPSVNQSVDDIPEAKSSQTGVSVRYVPDEKKNWYVFRATYGREDKAFEYIVNDNTFVYVAKLYVKKKEDGKAVYRLQSLIPSIIFVYTTREKADEYHGSLSIPFVNYYYDHFKKNKYSGNDEPLIVPEKEMMNFISLTRSKNEHIKSVSESQCHYKSGDIVRIIHGAFEGVVGKIARVSGQQRCIISITGIGLFCTAYIPTDFFEKVEA